MKYHICTSGKLIGSSNLEFHDPSMGIVHGPFLPAADYKDVEHIFRLFTQATIENNNDVDGLNEYYQRRDELGFYLETSTGQRIPTSCIHIVDWSKAPGDYQVEIILESHQVFKDFFDS